VRRREFITLLGGAAAAHGWSIAARAQASSVHSLIGMLSPLSARAATRNVAAFRSALRDLGYVEGRNVTMEFRFGDGVAERMAPLAYDLVTLKPDVLVAGSQSGALAVHNATRTIPIVTMTPADPVVSGFARSLAKPGGNITGLWLLGSEDAVVGKRLDFLKLAVPGLARLAVIVNPDDPTDHVQIPRLPAAARALGLALEVIEVRDASELDRVSAEIIRAEVQGLFVGQSPLFNSARAQIAAIVAQLKLPAVYGFREFADAGGLMSYGPNLPDMYRQAARQVDRILKGASPAEIPFELPTRYELIVNLKTAKAMGLAISDSFLLLADEVIE
jgi:putative tryptophan/tyrosine transport system substrate-binding protein